jgi:copper chaperone NosL
MARKVKALLFLFLIFSLLSCSKEIKSEEIEPYDICYLCKMAISQLEFATEIVTPDGEVYKFDDIGCMIEFSKMRDLPKCSVMFVRDFYTKEWV